MAALCRPRARSLYGPIHSVASMAPVCRAVKISPAGRLTTVPPILVSTSPPRPGVRIFRPLKSSTLLISLLNQPAVCTPVAPQAKGTTLNGLYTSSHSCMPPP
ncbi:hypothetical protein D3C81_1363010 [compost metagenome]